jgi:hypothetical protein
MGLVPLALSQCQAHGHSGAGRPITLVPTLESVRPAMDSRLLALLGKPFERLWILILTAPS